MSRSVSRPQAWTLRHHLKGQYHKLNVTNNAISHEVLCSFAADPSNDGILPNPLRCTGGKFNEITLDVAWSGAAPNLSVKIEELWYCLEHPETNVNPYVSTFYLYVRSFLLLIIDVDMLCRSVIVASGSESLALSCESHVGITGAPDDIVTICADLASSHAVDGIQIAKQSLPPFSLVTANPVHGGCTFDSIISPTFYYRGMFFETKPYSSNDLNNTTLSRFSGGLTGLGFQNYFFSENKAISGAGVNTV